VTDSFKKYRRQFRLWNNNRKLKQERNAYLSKFNRTGLSIPDNADLRSEINKQFPKIIPKPKGHLQIIAVYHHYNWENYSLKPALEKFGDVRHYDGFEAFSQTNKKTRRKIKMDINSALLQQMDTWMKQDRADVIFTYLSGEMVNPETLKIIRSHGVPMMNLALNDKEHFVGKIRSGLACGSRDICRYFDLCWTSTEDALVKYRVEGARSIYLPEGANPEIHKPYETEKTIDVSFVGQCYGNRAAVISELSRRGIVTDAYGYGWPRGPLELENMVKLYSRSKINLGFGGVEGHKDTFCLKGRDFEIPMSGGLYLTEDHPELASAFRPGDEIITYSGIDDLVRKIQYYLSHPAEAEAVRKKGRDRALRDHTWEARFGKTFRLLNVLG